MNISDLSNYLFLFYITFVIIILMFWIFNIKEIINTLIWKILTTLKRKGLIEIVSLDGEK